MVVAVLQARASSSRLPGKVMREILGRPMIELQIERMKRARLVDRWVLATSTDPSDDVLAGVASRAGMECHRGSLEDVLDRFHGAVGSAPPDSAVVRLTADCPLGDGEMIDRVIAFFRDGGFDYASNNLKPTFPDGLDVEVFRKSALEIAWKEAKLPSQREHVTPFLYSHPERFRVGSFEGATDLSHLRWTVDEASDFEVIRQVYEALYPKNAAFTTADVLAFFAANPAVAGRNAAYKRNEGYAKSLARDAEWLKKGKPGS